MSILYASKMVCLWCIVVVLPLAFRIVFDLATGEIHLRELEKGDDVHELSDDEKERLSKKYIG